MNTVIIVLLVMVVLPIICSWVSGYCRQKQFGEIDNKQPRQQNASLKGLGARAVAAQANAWEALMVFSATLLALSLVGINPNNFAIWLWLFLAARVLHALCYFANIDIVRSLSFVAGYGICIYLLVQAI